FRPASSRAALSPGASRRSIHRARQPSRFHNSAATATTLNHLGKASIVRSRHAGGGPRRRGYAADTDQAQSMRSIPCGSPTHGCLRTSYTDTCGGGKPGSANTPTGTLTTPGIESGTNQAVTPQCGQKWKRHEVPSSPVRTNAWLVPWVATAPIGNLACTANTLQARFPIGAVATRSEEHTSELQSRENLVCRLLLEKKNYN